MLEVVNLRERRQKRNYSPFKLVSKLVLKVFISNIINTFSVKLTFSRLDQLVPFKAHFHGIYRQINLSDETQNLLIVTVSVEAALPSG